MVERSPRERKKQRRSLSSKLFITYTMKGVRGIFGSNKKQAASGGRPPTGTTSTSGQGRGRPATQQQQRDRLDPDSSQQFQDPDGPIAEPSSSSSDQESIVDEMIQKIQSKKETQSVTTSSFQRTASFRPRNYKSSGSFEEDPDEMAQEEETTTNATNSEKDTFDAPTKNTTTQHHIYASAGTHRLNRILLSKQQSQNHTTTNSGGGGHSDMAQNHQQSIQAFERVSDPSNTAEVGDFCAQTVLPPLRVDPASIGGAFLEAYPTNMVQETIVCAECSSFETTGKTEMVPHSLLQFPEDYVKHKRSLGLFFKSSAGHRHRRRYIILARSTNRPLIPRSSRAGSSKLKTFNEFNTNQHQHSQQNRSNDRDTDDYDAMYGLETQESKDFSEVSTDDPPVIVSEDVQDKEEASTAVPDTLDAVSAEDEVSSFPVLVCMTLHSDGSGPDIRKMIPLDQLSTVQDLHTTVVQLAFVNGDSIRIDFGGEEEDKVAEASMDKERFIWSLLQTHAILCTTVVERNTIHSQLRERKVLPPLNVRNLDRAELQYVATVNGFLKDAHALRVLFDRQRGLLEKEADDDEEQKVEMDAMDDMAYDLMMGNFATRVTIFQSEEERKDAEEILNMPEWTEMLNTEETAALNVAERLGLMLQERMHDLEAETCRRLIAWEDEKQLSSMSDQKLFEDSDKRDTVDALALASLFKMLESLDTELEDMEGWLQNRAAAIKPLTDDCADIEEENRQLEQQRKSYDLLGDEMKRLLRGLDLDEEMEDILKDPTTVLVYEEGGRIDEDASEEGFEQILEAGKALQESMEYPKKSGGMHLKAVSERAEGLTRIANRYCTSLAQIISTIMETQKGDVVAGSDYGKVSKSDTHGSIAKKIRDTQKKFQTALLGYIKAVELLAALSPDLLPALRDAYAEMTAEGILMKKRCKGYFQALPGRNAAYLDEVGKDIRDYVPFDENAIDKRLVNAPDIRNAVNELLPIIAREAYFVSAVFGDATKEQDGREKKRNFENARKAVDTASQHFRYYIYRTCGIREEKGENLAVSPNDAILCLVASICLHEAMDPYVDREKKGGDHSLSLAYVRATILDLRKKADKQWTAWVEKQIKWIKQHDGVPANGKRSGVFPSFARFPLYLDHVMRCVREGKTNDYNPDLNEIKVVSYYFQKMAQALLDSLRECSSRETVEPHYGHVMMMENTYYFTHSMKERGGTFTNLFSRQITKANALCKQSTDAYLGWVIKREFSTLHELFSRISQIRKEHGDREVPVHITKQQFTRLMTKEASREVLKDKITSMYSRMEKHMSEESGALPVVWKALVKILFEWFGRWEKLSTHLYRFKLDCSAVDVVRIAKSAGGGGLAEDAGSTGDFGFKNMLASRERVSNSQSK